MFSEQSPLFHTAFRHTVNTFPGLELRPSPIPDGSELDRLDWLVSLAWSGLSLLKPLKRGDLGPFSDVDLVISIGGHRFVTYGGPGDLLRLYANSYPLLLALRVGTPFAICSQSIGPLHSFAARHFIRILLQKAVFVGVRERLSKEELVRCGFSSNRIYLVPDLAFLIEPASTERLAALLQQHGLKPREFIALTPRQWFMHEDPRYLAYLEALEDLARYLERRGLRVAIVAHTLGPTPFEDDRLACRDLMKRLTDLNGICLIEEDLNPVELAALYRQAMAVVGTRLHSVIFSFIAGTPAFALSYSGPKATGTMDLFGLKAYTADVASLQPESLQAGVESLLRHEVRLRLQIHERVAILRKEIIQAMKEMLERAGCGCKSGLF